MLRRHAVTRRLALLAGLAVLPAAAYAADPTQGTSCTNPATGPISGSTNGASLVAPAGGNNLVCVSGTWQYPAYQFGSTAASCTSTNAGAVQWTGTVFQGCDGTTWNTLNSGLGYMGGLTLIGKGSCNWTVGTAWADFSADASCNTATADGAAISPGKYPAIQFSTLPPGTYKVTFNIPADSSDGCILRISDGTSTAGLSDISFVASTYTTGIFSYASTQTNITFSLQGRVKTANNCTVYGDAATTGLTVTDFVSKYYVEKIQ